MNSGQNTPRDILAENRHLLLADVQKWLSDLACNDLQSTPQLLVPGLLSLIALRLGQMQNNRVGANYYRITPVLLTTDGQRIVEQQPEGLVRKVILFVDNASGGPTPTIRVGTNKGGTASGGVRVNAGVGSELGEVPPFVELWAASTVNIQGYVIEFA